MCLRGSISCVSGYRTLTERGCYSRRLVFVCLFVDIRPVAAKTTASKRGLQTMLFYPVVQFFDAALAGFAAKSSLLSRNCKLPTCWKFWAKHLQFFFILLVHSLPKFVNSCHYIFHIVLSSGPILILSNYFYSQFLLNNFF